MYQGPGMANDWAAAIAVDRTDKVFVTGYSSTEHRDRNEYVTVAYSVAGTALWTNRYQGFGIRQSAEANGLAVDRRGDVIVTGSSSGLYDHDFATIKYSSAGVPLWTNRYNGPGNSLDLAVGVALNSKDEVFVAGESWGDGTRSDFVTLAYSSDGIPLWTNRYGGLDYDIASSITVDDRGNVFVTGWSWMSNKADFATVAYSTARATAVDESP